MKVAIRRAGGHVGVSRAFGRNLGLVFNGITFRSCRNHGNRMKSNIRSLTRGNLSRTTSQTGLPLLGSKKQSIGVIYRVKLHYFYFTATVLW